MNLPPWITRAKLTEALHNFLKSEIEIIDYASKNAVAVGDNYISDLFRITITYNKNKSKDVDTISIIVKCAGDHGSRDSFEKSLKLFEKETLTFNNVMPRLHKITGEVCFAAECLLTGTEPLGHLILTDLSPLGYKLVDKSKGLDLDHCFLVMEKLAKMHAASAVLYEKDPHSMEGLDKGLFTNQFDSPMVYDFVVGGFKSVILATKSWPGYERYGEKLQKNMDKIFEKSMNACKRDPNQFNVFNHGDLWLNNIMYRYDENDSPVDIKFVDFQVSIFTTPSLDLHTFIYTSTKKDIEFKHLDRLLGYYYENLAHYLAKFGYPKAKIPTYKQIHDDFVNRGFYGLVVIASLLPIVRCPSDRSDASYDEFAKGDDNEFRKACFQNPSYVHKLQQLFPVFDKLGYLDF